MLDFYAEGEYDLSGFAVGTVKKDSVIDGKNTFPVMSSLSYHLVESILMVSPFLEG